MKPGDMYQSDDPQPVSPDLYQRAYVFVVLAMIAGAAMGFIAGRMLP